MADVQNNEIQVLVEEKKEEIPYSFIEETIRPRRKGKKVIGTVVLAIIFGIVSSIVFCVSIAIISRVFHWNQSLYLGNNTSRVPLTMPSSQPKPSVVPSASPNVTSTPAATSEGILSESNQEAIEWYENMNHAVQELANEVNESIVTVTSVTSGVDVFEKTYENANSTSGTIIGKKDGYILILVNYSKIEKAESLRVTFYNSQTVSATLYNKFEELNFAIVAVENSKLSESLRNKVKVATLGESCVMEIGDPVIAVGSPNGYMYSVDIGIVTTAMNEEYITDSRIELFNTNMAYNANGDGVLINVKGEVVGIITHNYQQELNESLTTCIGATRVNTILNMLVNKTKFRYFGIVAGDVTPAVAEQIGVDYGVYVTEVKTDSPAFEEGILKGDVIQKIDDVTITNMTVFFNTINEYEAGDLMKVSLVRISNGEAKDVTVTVQIK